MEEIAAVRLSPLHAVVFACIFQDRKKAGPAMLEFLNAILVEVGEEPIAEIIDMKSEYSLLGESAGLKYGRLDVRVKGESGRLFNIEVQIDKDYMNERGSFYGYRMAAEEFEAGMTYNGIPPVRVITIDDFHVREGSERVVERVRLLYEDNPEEATPAFKMYHIQLPEFRKKYKSFESVKGEPFLTWLYLLDEAYKNEEEMKMLAQMSVGMKNFAEQYGIAINDPMLIRRYRMYQDSKRDEATRIAVAEQKAHLDDAKRMKAKKYPIADIAEITGLSVAEIDAL
ncbi:MAG: Rpn family recombination-promoting nuclease/putative transposase [Clostridia bacterium]|nr:Rpn family recombination-promoting nuclease/putative transposase [Clostridia bacterium]